MPAVPAGSHVLAPHFLRVATGCVLGVCALLQMSLACSDELAASAPSRLFLRVACCTPALLDAFFMVWIAIIFGDNLGIPQSVMGLTVLAMGTSVPDMISSVIVTLHGGTADAPDARR